MQPDMWSGWGIRTLSADHPAFNPYSYQTGSVWPHDNGIIALGFKRYGFAAEAAAVARDVSDAASHFLSQPAARAVRRHPARTPSNFPVQYLGANVPQAWAAGSVFMLLQAMLGFLPDAPREPALRRSRICRIGCRTSPCATSGSASTKFDIRFWREGAETQFEVVKGGVVEVIRRKLGAAGDELRAGTHDTEEAPAQSAAVSACRSTRRKLPPQSAANSSRP